MLDILAPEDFPSHNKGEAALLFGMLESLNVLKPYRLTLFSMNPDEDQKNYRGIAHVIDSRGLAPAHMLDGLGSTKRKLVNYLRFFVKHMIFLVLYKLMDSSATRIMRREIWKSYLNAGIVLLSHDSFYTPLYHGTLLLFFKILKKPTVLYASTIIPPSPYQSEIKILLRNRFNRFVLKRAALITLREKLSYDYMQSLDIEASGTRVEWYPDLAFILKPVSEKEVDEIMKKEKLPADKKLVGLAISQRKLDFAFPEIPSLDERREKALNAVVKMVDYITGDLDAVAVFVPHSIGPTSRVDDRVTAGWILDRALHKEKIIVICNNYTSQQLKGLAGRFFISIGTRLHYAIDSACMGIPSMIITHREDFRCHGIIGDTLNQKAYVYDIEAIDESGLLQMVDRLWNKRSQVHKYLERTLPAIMQQTLEHGMSVKALLNQLRRTNRRSANKHMNR